MNETAPLLSIPEVPAPEGGVGEWFEGFGGVRLRAARFPAKGKVRGSVVLSTGRTETIEKYFEVISELQGRGFVVLAHDWRGQGLSGRLLSERLRGHAQGIEPFLKDFSLLLDHFEARLPKPWISLAHSMGGGLTMLALSGGAAARFVAAAFSAPMWAVVTKGVAYPVARALTWTSSRIGFADSYLFGDPGNPFKITFEGDRLGHERWRWDRYRTQINACPDLALGNLTWGWLEFAMALSSRIRRPGVVEKLTLPTLVAAAGDDDRVQTPLTRAQAARLPNGKYVEIPGSYHEILMERDDIRAVFWTAFDELVDSVAPR
ncbi:alpha/beta hydrolase [soil metagenome]